MGIKSLAPPSQFYSIRVSHIYIYYLHRINQLRHYKLADPQNLSLITTSNTEIASYLLFPTNETTSLKTPLNNTNLQHYTKCIHLYSHAPFLTSTQTITLPSNWHTSNFSLQLHTSPRTTMLHLCLPKLRSLSRLTNLLPCFPPTHHTILPRVQTQANHVSSFLTRPWTKTWERETNFRLALTFIVPLFSTTNLNFAPLYPFNHAAIQSTFTSAMNSNFTRYVQ